MSRFLLIMASLLAAPAPADTVMTVVPVRAGTVIDASHLAMAESAAPGALEDMRDAIGLEARINLYSNRPVHPGDLGTPTLINRNEFVAIIYNAGPLRITAEGRALSRAGEGELVRVMNMASRNTVIGLAIARGQVEVTR